MFYKKYLIFFVLSNISLPLVNYNLELKNLIAFENDSNDFGTSDVWGYTDETGIEYAIVGYRYGTMIYDVSSSEDLKCIRLSGSPTDINVPYISKA